LVAKPDWQSCKLNGSVADNREERQPMIFLNRLNATIELGGTLKIAVVSPRSRGPRQWTKRGCSEFVLVD
jgi:hypothetical protein